MRLNKKAFLILSFYFIIRCNLEDEKKNCIDSKKITLDFNFSNFKFNSHDNLIIDDIAFRHSYYLDSVKKNNYLPKEHLILFRVEDKIAKQETNPITYSRVLWNKLKETNLYKDKNNEKLITTGILQIERKDEKRINICTSKKYLKNIKP